MKQQLLTQIEQLFAGAALNRENLALKEEIIEGACQHYDRLIAESVSPEDAVRTVINHIGDIQDRLHNPPAPVGENKKAVKKGRGPVCGAINGALWVMTIVAYIQLSQWTGKWEITWVIFLIAVAATSIVEAIFDLCQGGSNDEE